MRLGRRGDLWIVVLAVVLLTVVGYVSGLTSSQNVQFGPPGEEVPPEILEQWEAQAKEALAGYAFPNSIRMGLEGGRVLVFAIIVYLAAAFTGADFDYGTIRTSLVARGDRRGFIAVRLAATFLAAIVLIAIVVLLSMTLPLIAAALGTDFPAVEGPSPGAVAGMIGSALATAAFLVGLTTLLAIIFRNAAIAIVLTVVYAFADGAISGLIGQVAGQEAALRWVPPVTNGQLLFDRAGGAALAPEWPTLFAVAVAIGWIVVTWALCLRSLSKADIHA
jgi:hypothetical protein